MSNYKIDTDKLIVGGIETVKFDPSKVILVSDEDSICKYSNNANRTIVYKYDDVELSHKIYDLNFSCGWTDTRVKNEGKRKNLSGLTLVFRKSSGLRKRPNKEEYTQTSLDNHKKHAKLLDQYDVDYATEQFKKAILNFEQWYVDNQIKQTVERYSSVNGWQFDDEQEIVDMDNEIVELQNKLKELKNKRFDKKCDLVLNYIKNEEEKIHVDFKQPLIEAVNIKRQEGFKSSFF
jgi:hypothetical protein